MIFKKDSLTINYVTKLIVIFSVVSFFGVLPSFGEEKPDYPVTGIYSFEIGRRSEVAQYLSPITYHGTDFALSGFWTKAMPFNPQRFKMDFDARVSYVSMLNLAGSATTLGLDAHFSWHMDRYFRLPHDLTVSIGGGPAITGGVLALLRNSNNPVDVTIKAAIELGASLHWRSKIGRIPIVCSERLSIPLIGAFFMPQYGETFYEIYLGNRRGLAHFAWPGNMPGIDNVLSISMDLGNTALYVGYRLSYTTAYANNLSTRMLTNGFVIGVIPGGLGLKRTPCRPQSRPF